MSADCPFSFPEGQRKLLLCFVFWFDFFFFLRGGHCVQGIVCTAQTPLWWRTSWPSAETAHGPLRDCLGCREPPDPRSALPQWPTSNSWSMWGYKGLAFSAHLRTLLKGWFHSRSLPVGMPVVGLPHSWTFSSLSSFSSLPLHKCWAEELSSITLLHSKFHLGVSFPWSPSCDIFFCF